MCSYCEKDRNQEIADHKAGVAIWIKDNYLHVYNFDKMEEERRIIVYCPMCGQRLQTAREKQKEIEE